MNQNHKVNHSQTQSAPQEFHYLTCLPGFESNLKEEISKKWPDSKFSFSRPGLLTFKNLPSNFDLKSIAFSQSGGKVLGKPEQGTVEELFKKVVTSASLLQMETGTDRRDLSLHLVFLKNDLEQDDTEHLNVLNEINAYLLKQTLPPHIKKIQLMGEHFQNYNLRPVEILLTEPKKDLKPGTLEWIIGEPFYSSYDRVGQRALETKETLMSYPSRAFLKTQEVRERYHLDFKPDQEALEIGSSPGGSVLYLLENKLLVTGIDPAEMDEKIKKSVHYNHLSCSIFDMKENLFPDSIDWLLMDIHAPPLIVLKALETYIPLPWSKNLKGAAITIKLNQMKFAKEVRIYQKRLELVFKKHTALKVSYLKQLSSHRREISIVLLPNEVR